MALFVRLSPWAWGQKDPARAGVEAFIQVRDEEGEKGGNVVDGDRDVAVDQEQNGHAKHGGSGKDGTSSGGGDADGATNGHHRRNSSTHSHHQQQTPNKSWKNGGSAKKR